MCNNGFYALTVVWLVWVREGSSREQELLEMREDACNIIIFNGQE